jgi:hypothetical protein
MSLVALDTLSVDRPRLSFPALLRPAFSRLLLRTNRDGINHLKIAHQRADHLLGKLLVIKTGDQAVQAQRRVLPFDSQFPQGIEGTSGKRGLHSRLGVDKHMFRHQTPSLDASRFLPL